MLTPIPTENTRMAYINNRRPNGPLQVNEMHDTQVLSGL